MGWEVDGNGEVDVREQDGSEKGVGGRVGFPKLGVEVVGRESCWRPRIREGFSRNRSGSVREGGM